MISPLEPEPQDAPEQHRKTDDHERDRKTSLVTHDRSPLVAAE